jgi:hypothetical protein
MQEGRRGRVCSNNERDGKGIRNFVNQKGGDYLQDLGIDDNILVKWIKKYDRVVRTGSFSLSLDRV